MEPEHLHADGARLGRGRAWVVLGVVLAVLVALVVLRLERPGSDTSPRPLPTPAPTSSETSHAWPADLPPGMLFVASEGWVQTVDTRDGRVTRTRVRAAPGATSITLLGDGVLVWQGGRARPTRLVNGVGYAGRGGLRSATSFLPGPGGSVWAAAVAERPSRTTWRLVDVDGRSSTSVSVEGSAQSDGAGGLLSVTDGGVRPVYPKQRPRRPGDVVATGPGGYVVRSCAEPDCRFTLHRHGDEPGTELTTAVGEDTAGGTLSPTNRLLAVTETVGGTSTLRVSVVGTGQIDEIFAEPKGSTNDAAWLDDRWLALISEDQLMLYDARDDRVVTPAVPLSSIGPVVWRPV